MSDDRVKPVQFGDRSYHGTFAPRCEDAAPVAAEIEIEPIRQLEASTACSEPLAL